MVQGRRCTGLARRIYPVEQMIHGFSWVEDSRHFPTEEASPASPSAPILTCSVWIFGVSLDPHIPVCWPCAML